MSVSSSSSDADEYIFPRACPRDRHLNSHLHEVIGLRNCFGRLKIFLWKSRVKLRKRVELSVIVDEEEICSAEAVVVLRNRDSRNFIFGFQGCQSAVEMKLRISKLCGLPYHYITLQVNCQILDGQRPWNFDRLMMHFSLPVAGISPSQQSIFEIEVVISEGSGNGAIPFITDWPGEPDM